ncbi:uncharacterized protein KGF55_002867 [Candida pseudojiufengensis]|uniref:uncharacterized protein n=1 Tax=Candida pseudojiufengensis TaxID=497109 RepID=UPI0022248985|nr:uncharacterized protein KGF55_002867 [Candida pseudojiufengensis]KAI5963075.1 hypothetical protein KGF55_002867 [Candida pseudojiufengensis]
MQSFANSVWSADFITGLKKLETQSLKSITELHDFRKLVFNYLKYYHSNSEFLSKNSRDIHNGEVLKRVDKDLPNYSKCIEIFKNEMLVESNILLQLASAIDKFVLDDVTMYLKHHEPKIKKEISRLEEIYDQYIDSIEKLKKLKNKYFDQLRLKEFAETQGSKYNDPIKTQRHEEEIDYSDEESYADDDFEEEKIQKQDVEFQFPLNIGTAVFETEQELQQTISQLMGKTPTIKRKIPIPGYKIDIFASESLCDVLTKLRIKGLKPSRSNFEKFGQSLIDLKLITPTSIFQKKFKSEGVWFEWSDLADYISQNIPNEQSPSTPIKNSSVKSKENTPNKITSPQTKFIQDMSETSTKFSAMFNSMRSSIMKTNHDEVISDTLDQYKNLLLETQELKYFFEIGYDELSKYLEKFEKMKIHIIYNSSSKLSEIISKFHHDQIKKINEASKSLSSLKTKENYEYDFALKLESVSSGIYVALTSDNELPQTLINQFNIYNDIPLQVLKYQLNDGEDDDVLSIASVPVLLYSLIQILDDKGSDLKLAWLQPLNFQSAWTIKQELTQIVADHVPNELDVLAGTANLQESFINEVLEHFQKKKIDEIVNFLKSWLLEIKDSIIPFMVYDLILKSYKDGSKSSEDIIKHLSSIPRSNLASLLCILEHICDVFELGKFLGYGLSDDLNEKLNEEEKSIESVSEELNSMNKIGSLPFVHIIMRPPPTKKSTGFKPPIEEYNIILKDLLKLSSRKQLFNTLIEHEVNYRKKKEAERKTGIPTKKLTFPSPSSKQLSPPPEKIQVTVTAGDDELKDSISTPNSKALKQEKHDLKTPKPLSADTFSLRPFKTKSTPIPSPQGSPKHQQKEFSEEIKNRPRSASNRGPMLDVKFEQSN